MAPNDLDELGADLYQEVLLDHYKNPRHKGKLAPADIAHDGNNPTCGDEVKVFARLDKSGAIQNVAFEGKGCAISQASADMFYGDVKGKKAEDVLKLNIDHIQGLLGITVRPARVKCATLGLVALKEGIREFQQKSAPKKPLPGFKKK